MSTENIIQLFVGLLISVSGFVLVMLIGIIAFFLKQSMDQQKANMTELREQSTKITQIEGSIGAFREFIAVSSKDQTDVRHSLSMTADKLTSLINQNHQKVLAEIASCTTAIARIETTLMVPFSRHRQPEQNKPNET